MAITTEYTVPSINRIVYSGLSTDTKPTTCVAGSIFHETDTVLSFEFDGSAWNEWGTNGARDVNQATLLSGEDQTNDVIVTESGRFSYETVAASQTAQVLGSTGAAGDYLHAVIITASTGTITILDNATSVAVIPATATGVWPINCVSSSGAWKITTAASTSCTCIGRFT